MSDFLRILLDFIQFLWPLHRVQPWQRGIYIICGKWTFDVGPGIYPIVPWFSEVRCETVILALVSTPRQDITLTDGKTLTFSSTANVRITNITKAYLDVENFHQTTQENIAAVLAEKLAEVDASRLSAEKRGRLLSDLRRWVNDETQVYGVAVEKLRFTNFVLNVRTIRLLQESGAIAPW